MPPFRYVGTEGRTFPDLGLVVEPGDIVDVGDNFDTRLFVDAPGEAVTVHDVIGEQTGPDDKLSHDDAGAGAAPSEEA